VPQELFRQLFPSKNSGRDGGPDRRLKMIGRVPFPDLARPALMELINQVVEISCPDFAALPPVELRPKLEEGVSELAIVSDRRLLSKLPFHAFGGCIDILPEAA
jgi:hypothetical protein